MWIKRLTIVVCFVAVTVYAQRTQPNRTPTTPTSPLESATESPPVIGQEGCLSRILNGVSVQSANNSRFIVVTKRGRGRSFRRRHPDLLGSTIIQSDGTGRDLPVTVVNSQEQAEMVRNNYI